MIIRRARPDDSDAIGELYTELEKDAVYYQPEHFVMSAKGARDMSALFEGDDTQVMFIAEDEGMVIGFLHAAILKAADIPCLKPQMNVYIRDMVVTETYRSRGIGSLLMDAVKEYGIMNGADFIRTQVFPMNKDGLRFYSKNGFGEKMITIECPLK